MALVGSPAEQAPGVPIDPAHPDHQGEVLVAGGELLVHPLGQLPQGGLDLVQIGLLVGLKPTALVVEADAPEEVVGLLGKTLKHRRCHLLFHV